MTTALTIVHVAISLVGIGAGFVVMWGLLVSKSLNTWTAIFLAATTATSVTGFFFPIERFTPARLRHSVADRSSARPRVSLLL